MVYDTFSKRQKATQTTTQEIYIYDVIPASFRTQIVFIWYRALGNENEYLGSTGEGIRYAYECLVNILREEVGVFVLPPTTKHVRISFLEELVEYFQHEGNIDRVLNVIELSFRFINKHASDFRYQFKRNSEEIADQAISDLNIRFKEHSIGYRFESSTLIRIDSEFLHEEATKPALLLLTKPEYKGVQDEFLQACNHYKYGRKKEVLDACVKAFESMMKSICTKRGWNFHPNATVSPLIKTCLQNGLIPSFLQTRAESLQSLLESGVPTIGNKLSRHGQGSEILEIPNYLVRYALLETAAALILFDEAEAALKQVGTDQQV